ncbi:hypothetical protein VB796_16030 [Arcicella sp. LKC2W]|uniref:hypothetical protein n=1 Tax=Arcicella sp. LKC2W TaxID=2984198 RepID=UPI002B1EFE75|nr:hypothetical protein [Arcicella sp. LKC2W]MEA5460565.1 hypothetical protein [Arcicella sp. LKC2W]
MKQIISVFIIALFIGLPKSNANNIKIIDPIQQLQIDELGWMVDNPKGKLKIRFVRNEDKSGDSTNKPKGFFGKLKNVVNMLLDASDNPPFRVEIVREKEKKN